MSRRSEELEVLRTPEKISIGSSTLSSTVNSPVSEELQYQDYQLPKVVEAIRQSWIATTGALLIFSTLVAILEAQLLILDSLTNLNRAAGEAFRVFSFAGIFLNLGAGCTAVLALDDLGTLPVDAMECALKNPESLPARVFQGQKIPPHLLRRSEQRNLLRQFGMESTFRAGTNHAFTTFIFGFLCPFVQLGIYLWYTQSAAVAGSSMIFLFAGVYTLLQVVGVSFFEARTDRPPDKSRHDPENGAQTKS